MYSKSSSVITDFNTWSIQDLNGVKVLISPLLHKFSNWFTHVFTTRIGGMSLAPYDYFNLGLHVADEAVLVNAKENRKVLLFNLKINSQNLTVPSQRHSNNVAVINCAMELDNTDAVITGEKDVPVMLTFADCVPIVLLDFQLKMFSIVHAGLQGTKAQILPNTIKAMLNQGSKAKNIVIAIGPAIDDCCYQTSLEVAYELKHSVPKNVDECAYISYRSNIPYPSLKLINRFQAQSLGIDKIDICSLCTSCNNEFFYSHRASHGITGRQGVLACLSPSVL